LRLCEAGFEVGKELVNESEVWVDKFGHALRSCCGLDLMDVISIARLPAESNTKMTQRIGIT
jgi:hypothetical protein